MFKAIQEKLGPGLLYAATAVGVSHLVSSTTAGATYGLIMVAYVVLVCLVKYPTFLFGAYYAAATGETLVDGYERMGKWIVVLFFFIQLFEFTFAIAGVSVTTAAIVENVVGFSLPGVGMELALIVICMVILALGRYSLLEDITTILVIVFTFGVIFATLTALGTIDTEGASLSAELSFDTPLILFLIAVAGWMPTGTAGSVGLSLWVKAKSLRLNRAISIKEAVFDFHVGYLTAIITAACFVALGTFVMFIDGVALESNGALFAGQLMNLFTSTIGSWVYPVIAIAGVAVMFSTLLTLVDLLPRSSAAVFVRLMPAKFEGKHGLLYVSFILVELFLVFGVLLALMDSFAQFIGLVTSMGFIVAPAFSLLNHLVMFSPLVPKDKQPSQVIRIWSLCTVVILTVVAVMFLTLY